MIDLGWWESRFFAAPLKQHGSVGPRPVLPSHTGILAAV